jgi:hypothetical protein
MNEQRSGTPKEQAATATDVVSQARDLALNLAGQATDLLKQGLARQSSRSASDLADLATGLRLTAKQLSTNAAAPLLNKTADRIERLSQALQEPDLNAIGRNLGRLAVDQPWLFVGGATAAGVVCARVVKGAMRATRPDSERGRPATQRARSTRRARAANPLQERDRS